MDLKQLQRFVVLAEEGSFARTSERLYVSQPAVTRSIQFLEATLGVSLFERSARGVEATAFGLALLPYARSILNDRARALEAIAALSLKTNKEVRLAITHRAAAAVAPHIIGRLALDRPDLTLHILQGEFPSLLDRLREGEADVAFGARDSYLDLTGLSFAQVTTATPAFVVRRQHPLAVLGRCTFQDLAAATWLLPDETVIQQAWRRMFEVRRLSPPQVLAFGCTGDVLRRTLLAADVIAIMDLERIASDVASGDLVQVKADDEVFTQQVGIFQRTEGTASLAQAAVAKALKEIFAPVEAQMDGDLL